MTAPENVTVAAEVPVRARASSYPEPYASWMQGRSKRPLGDLFGLANFGVNLTDEAVVHLEIGDHTPGDSASDPDDDIAARLVEGRWAFTRKDGSDIQS